MLCNLLPELLQPQLSACLLYSDTNATWDLTSPHRDVQLWWQLRGTRLYANDNHCQALEMVSGPAACYPHPLHHW